MPPGEQNKVVKTFHRRRRAAGVVVAAVAVLAATVTPAATATTTPTTALSILPPGEDGLVNGAQVIQYEANGSGLSPAAQDQLAPYAALPYATSTLDGSNLSKYFIPETIGVPANPSRVERPGDDVTIYRDGHDVPHIFGSSLASMAFGAGYAAAEDRLFLMDVLRHYGEGDLSEFLGPSCSFEQMDHDQLLTAAYTPAQLQQQLDALPTRFGTLGSDISQMISSYVGGINQYIAQATTNPSMLPADYAAAVGPPQPWKATDVVALSSLIGAVATSGGYGIVDAQLLRYLQSKLGPSAGAAAFAAFKEQNDPAAPTTIPAPFAYMLPGQIDPSLTAIPDNPSAPLQGGPTDTTQDCQLSAPSTPTAAAVDRSVTALLRPRTGMSNAVVVGASHASGGHPIAVFGPELGYYAPEILMEEDLHAPGYSAAGAAFPGASFVVEIGRTPKFAWSATTASAQQTDTRIEAVCSPTGGTPQPAGVFYLFDGKCIPMGEQDHTEIAVTKPGGQGAPAVIDHRIYTTVHGIVQGWTTVAGKPVAVVDQRSTYGHEADSFAGFLRWGEPSLTNGPATWVAGAADITYSFNWFYVDDSNIAYVVSGLDPVRPADVDPNLPTWGTGRSEWLGWLAPADHPHSVNPPQGWLVSWNNKPAPEFSASDDLFGWGPVYRSQLLTSQLQSAFSANGGVLDPPQAVRVAELAATQDMSATATLPAVLSSVAASADPEVQALAAQLRSWLDAGAHRLKASPGDPQYSDAAAVAIWDETYPRVVEAIFANLFAAGGVTDVDGLPWSYDALPMPFAETPNSAGSHQGDGYYVGWEGYVVKALAQAAGGALADPFPPAVAATLCGGQGSTACGSAIASAFHAAYDALVKANGGSTDVGSWTADTATATQSAAQGSTVTMPEYDSIVYQAIGIVSPPAQDWQNRPTFQQVIQYG